MLVDTSSPENKSRFTAEGASRLLMAVVGTIMALGPGAAIVLAEGWAFGLVPFAALGVWLIALSAFYDRVEGPIKCMGFRVTIARRETKS